MEITHELSDGNITVGDDHLRCPEVRSQAKLGGEPSEIHDMSLLSTCATLTSACTAVFQRVGERMTEGLTALALPPVFPRCLHQCDVSRGLADVSCLPKVPSNSRCAPRKAKYDEPDLQRAHADHVRDVQRARHVRGDPGCFVAVRFWTHARHRDRRSRVAHESFFEPQGLPRALDADHVRDVPRACHERGDPGCCVPVWLKMHTRFVMRSFDAVSHTVPINESYELLRASRPHGVSVKDPSILRSEQLEIR